MNVGLWNLPAILAAVAGCGALIPAGDGDTDTHGDPDDDDGPIVDTELPSPTTGSPQDTDACDCPPGQGCDGYGDCFPYEECPNGELGPDGLCCYDEDGDGYPDCYCEVAEDCSPGTFCEPSSVGFGCSTAPGLRECDPDVETRVIALPIEASGAIALAFADVELGGGLELFVVQPGEARLVTAGGASVTSPVALAAADTDASAAAVDAGPGMGFAVSAPAGAQLVTFVEGTLVAGPLDGSGLARIVAGDFDGDGIDDIAGFEGETLVWQRGTWSGFTEAAELDASAIAPLIAGPFDGDGADDIAFHSGSGDARYMRAIARGGELQTLPDRPAMIQSLGTADFDGDGLADIVGISGWESTMVAFPWANADAGQFEPGVPRSMPDIAPGADLRYRLASGDFDGDGRDDVVIGSNSLIRILFGSGDMDFRCHADVIIQHRATSIAVGDLEGDGRADIAFSDGETTTVLAHE